MPIYEYECKSCGPFEVMQRITEEPLKKCESCGKPVRKLMSHTSFALKGGGWYKDLYSSSSKPAANSDSSSSTSSSSEKKADSGAKTESKPAAA